MKAIKIITHPVLLIISFLLILISGEHWGGFYLLYILLALPHGGIHAIFAIAGILLLVFSYAKYRREKKCKIEPVINIAGLACLLLSLSLFFMNDRQGYNDGTFYQAMPLISLGFFSIISISFIIDNITGLVNRKKNSSLLSLS